MSMPVRKMHASLDRHRDYTIMIATQAAFAACRQRHEKTACPVEDTPFLFA